MHNPVILYSLPMTGPDSAVPVSQLCILEVTEPQFNHLGIMEGKFLPLFLWVNNSKDLCRA
jgi:hypothetical protein